MTSRERLAQAAERLGLKHVVITSVTRDDLPDGGADHFRRCILAVRRRIGAVVEVLTPDFLGDTHALDMRSVRPSRKSTITTWKPCRVCTKRCVAGPTIAAAWICSNTSRNRPQASSPRAA